MTRKRAIKKLMGRGYSRNEAELFQTYIVEWFGCNKAVVRYVEHLIPNHCYFNTGKIIFGVDLNLMPHERIYD